DSVATDRVAVGGARSARRSALRRRARSGPRDAARADRPPARVRDLSDGGGPLLPRIRDYVAARLGTSRVVLENVERIAVGWSHETWLFDASFDEHGASRRLGLCLRRDPGNALLRHLSSLETQFKVLQCLDGTRLPTPKPYWYEPDSSILDAPFLVMEKVA